VNNIFAQSYKQTIGLDFFSRRLLVPQQGKGDIIVNMQLWDIGGQTLGSSMLQTYIFGASAIIFVYDVSNMQSFQNLEDWYDVVYKVYPDKMPYTALIGNKMDLPHLRVVRTEQHQKFANDFYMKSQFLLSAKTNDRITSSFTVMAADMIGVNLTQTEKESLETNDGRIIEATIVNHQQNDPDQKPLDLTNKRNCTIM
jgi:Ras-related protein Rab-28